MDLPTALWRVDYAGAERHPATARYAWDNRRRQPVGEVCLQCVDAGEILLTRTDGRVETVTAGQAFLFRFGEASRYGLPPGNRLPYITRWLSLRGAGLADHWDGLRERGRWVVPITPTLDGLVQRLTNLSQPAARTPATTMAAAVQGLVLYLAESGTEAERAIASPVDRAIDELVASPCSPWSLKQVAEDHGISREYLTRAFTARLGAPPATWLSRQRLARAQELLRETDLPVAEIARHCGLGSAHTLARQVRATTGRPPSRHRR